MATQARIPRNIALFVAYMQRTVAYLLATSPAPLTGLNWNRLNWTSAELAAWQAFLAEVLPLYTIYNANPRGNPPNTAAIHVIIKAVHAYDKANHPLDRIAAGNPANMVNADYTTFNIKHNNPVLAGSLPTARRVATENIVYNNAVGIGGAVIHYQARVNKSSKRPHKEDGYNVGIVYLILNATDAVPTTPDLLTTSLVFSRANGTFQLPLNSIGKRVALSFYWKHKTNPALDGPKSTISIVVIS